jgi:hypothetical protein
MTPFLIMLIGLLAVEYKPEKKEIYLSASMWWEHDMKYINWSETLTIE